MTNSSSGSVLPPRAPVAAMSPRERILAALRRQPVDHIPFVPLIDIYTTMDMPPEIPRDFSGTGRNVYAFGTIQASRALGCDMMIRHVFANEPRGGASRYLQYLGQFDPPVEVRSELKGHLLVETLNTPVGSLVGTWGYSAGASWIPHPVKHLVNNYEELKIYHYAVDHLSPRLPATDYEGFLEVDRTIGNDGIPTVSLMNTPLMYLIEMIWGLENTIYLLHDHRALVEDVLDKLHQSLKRYAELLADSPAQVIIEYENTSSTLISRAMFRRYCLPCLDEYAQIMEAAGKVFLVHMCGKIHSFKQDIGQGKFAGIADIAPPPTGDLALDEAAAAMPGKVIVGGIDATTFVHSDPALVRAEITGLIERIKPFRGVLLGSADTTPRGTPIENLRLIRDLVKTAGSYA